MVAINKELLGKYVPVLLEGRSQMPLPCFRSLHPTPLPLSAASFPTDPRPSPILPAQTSSPLCPLASTSGCWFWPSPSQSSRLTVGGRSGGGGKPWLVPGWDPAADWAPCSAAAVYLQQLKSPLPIPPPLWWYMQRCSNSLVSWLGFLRRLLARRFLAGRLLSYGSMQVRTSLPASLTAPALRPPPPCLQAATS